MESTTMESETSHLQAHYSGECCYHWARLLSTSGGHYTGVFTTTGLLAAYYHGAWPQLQFSKGRRVEPTTTVLAERGCQTTDSKVPTSAPFPYYKSTWNGHAWLKENEVARARALQLP